jgi:hypothetical protein
VCNSWGSVVLLSIEWPPPACRHVGLSWRGEPAMDATIRWRLPTAYWEQQVRVQMWHYSNNACDKQLSTGKNCNIQVMVYLFFLSFIKLCTRRVFLDAYVVSTVTNCNIQGSWLQISKCSFIMSWPYMHDCSSLKGLDYILSVNLPIPASKSW